MSSHLSIFFTVISPFWLKCLKSISLRKQERHTLSLPNIDKKTNKDECLFYLCYYVYYNQLPIYMLSCNLDKRKDVIHFYYTNYYKILQIKMSNYFYHEQFKNDCLMWFLKTGLTSLYPLPSVDMRRLQCGGVLCFNDWIFYKLINNIIYIINI